MLADGQMINGKKVTVQFAEGERKSKLKLSSVWFHFLFFCSTGYDERAKGSWRVATTVGKVKRTASDTASEN